MERVGVNRREITLFIGAGLGVAHAACADPFAQVHGAEAAARPEAGPPDYTPPDTVAPILSATGQTIDGEVAELPRLRLGRVTVSTWPVTFADLHTFRLWRRSAGPRSFWAPMCSAGSTMSASILREMSCGFGCPTLRTIGLRC